MENEEIIINAENFVVGRLASFAAKQALYGKKVIVLNSEKAIITGNKADIIEKNIEKKSWGGAIQRGPFFSSSPEKSLKRTIRGMLPYKKERGRNAYKRVKCYLSIPKEFEGKQMITNKEEKIGMSIGKISEIIKGGRK